MLYTTVLSFYDKYPKQNKIFKGYTILKKHTKKRKILYPPTLEPQDDKDHRNRN